MQNQNKIVKIYLQNQDKNQDGIVYFYKKLSITDQEWIEVFILIFVSNQDQDKYTCSSWSCASAGNHGSNDPAR